MTADPSDVHTVHRQALLGCCDEVLVGSSVRLYSDLEKSLSTRLHGGNRAHRLNFHSFVKAEED